MSIPPNTPYEGLAARGRRLAVALLVSCVGVPAAVSPASAQAAAGAPSELGRALEGAIAEPGSWSDLRLLVECREARGAGTLEVYGDGVGVWGGRRQFDLSAEEIAGLLARLREAGFTTMPETFGGKGLSDPGGREGAAPDDPAWATIVVCSVDLELDGESKRVAQLKPGVQSERFLALAAALLDAGRERGETGVAAADLRDALLKLASGDLAPRTLRLDLTRRPGTAGAGEGGFQLRLAGRRAASRPYVAGKGYGGPLVAELSPEEFATLARALADARPAEMPANLWAEEYTDLAVAVLGHRAVVQARQFGNLTPTTYGLAQLRFDRLLEALVELDAQVRVNGAP